MARDFVAALAHAFGRTADWARGHRASVTAIEREEAQARRAEALRRRWNRLMLEYQRAGERQAVPPAERS